MLLAEPSKHLAHHAMSSIKLDGFGIQVNNSPQSYSNILDASQFKTLISSISKHSLTLNVVSSFFTLSMYLLILLTIKCLLSFNLGGRNLKTALQRFCKKGSLNALIS